LEYQIMDFLWEMYEQQPLPWGELDAGAAKRQAGEARLTDRELQARCDRLELVTHAMWTLLREKLGLQENDLVSRVRELDLTDGRLDGRYGEAPLQCPACGRTTGRRRPTCIYCGAGLNPGV
jgi:hypothetical protein